MDENEVVLTSRQIRYLARVIEHDDPTMVKIADTNVHDVIVATYTTSAGDHTQVLINGDGQSMELSA